MKENHYAAAFLRIVTERAYTVPAWARQEQIDDGRTILEAISRTKIRHEGWELLVGDLIRCVVHEWNTERVENDSRVTLTTAKQALRNHGLSIVKSTKDGISKLAIHSEMVSKEVLKQDPEFKDLDISEPLLRIEGAKRERASFLGSKVWTVQIPISLVLPDEIKESK